MWRLKRTGTAEGVLFRKVSEKGHYASYGPDFTRQGTYCLSPSGVFLGSINTNDAGHMAAMMRKALERWKKLKRSDRLMKPVSGTPARLESKYPEDGLVLHMYMRDLDRPELEGWKATAWNQDYAWFKKEELAKFVPPDLTSGMTVDIPSAYVRRLARLHLVDQVRGQSTSYSPSSIEDAVLSSRVKMIVGDTVYVSFSGHTRAVEGSRGIDLNLYGEGEWNEKQKRFDKFDLVAIGQRWGGTQHNVRNDDPGPSPIGFAFTIAGNSPAEHVAPAFFYGYGW